MSGIAIFVAIAAFLLMAGLLLFKRLKTGEAPDSPDSKYVCNFCGETDCECEKLEPDP